MFVPNPLPPELDIEPRILGEIEEATHLLGQVEMCRTLLPNPNLLVYGSLRREALASSTIEGTIASPEELVLFQVARRSDREAVREVANYSVALEWGCDELGRLPISTRLILGLHERLLHGVRGSSAAGRFKDRQNYIGANQDTPIEEAVFVPPPAEEVVRLMTDLERYVNLGNAAPRLVRCALVHYQFETIHPFGDGNGRVGRLLIILHLMQLGLLSAPLIHPSVYFERTRQDYYQSLQAVRDKAGWNEWIEYFVIAIAQQSRETVQLAQALLNLQQTLRQDIADVRKRASTQAALEAFFDEPVLSISEVARRTGLSYGSAKGAVETLETRGIAREITGRKKGRAYACSPILNAIFPGAGEQR